MSTKKSVYEKFIIESADRSKTADISEGVIAFTYFENIGGDALDFSGSDVTINILNSKFVADKIVSAGEMSSIEVSNVKSTDSYSGIVSKDGSNVKITNIDLKRVQFPEFIKKKQHRHNHYWS